MAMKKIMMLLLFSAILIACNDDQAPQIDLSDVPEAARDSVKNSIKGQLEEAFPFQLDDFVEVEDSDVIFFPLEIYDATVREKTARWRQTGKFGGYSSYEDPIESWNIIFYNTKNKEYHALLKDTVGVVESYYQFASSPPDTIGYEKGAPIIVSTSKYKYFGKFAAKYLLFSLLFDHNEDGILDYKDPTQLYLTDKNGKQLTALTPPNTNLINWEFYQASNLLIVRTRTDENGDSKFDRKDRETKVFEIDLKNPAMGKPVFSQEFVDDLKGMMVEKYFLKQ